MAKISRIMESTLEHMPENARLWIYQADRPFTVDEEQKIKNLAETFVGQWAAHGQKLKAAVSIEHHQFIILAVDESFNQASGCSIDASVGLIQQIQDQFQINLLDRTKVAFLMDGKVMLVPIGSLKEAVKTGKIGAHTTVFNNLLNNAGELKTNWLLPAKDTWLSRYFS